SASAGSPVAASMTSTAEPHVVRSTWRARAPPRSTGSPSSAAAARGRDVPAGPPAAAPPLAALGPGPVPVTSAPCAAAADAGPPAAGPCGRVAVGTGRLRAATGAVSCQRCQWDSAMSARDLLEDDVPRPCAVVGRPDVDTALERLAGALETLRGVGVHGEERLPGLHPLARLGVQLDARGRLDGVTLPRAARPETPGADADGVRVEAGEHAVGRRRDRLGLLGGRQRGVRVAALGADHP